MAGRALHFVFKVADRTLTVKFYKEILGMKVLRHEEFTEGCAAACNGPYDNRWSKTMVGYGPEDTHFVVELTYNYNVDHYVSGNDFMGMTIKSREAIARAKANLWPITEEGGLHILEAPGGYKFFLINEPEPEDKDPVQKISLASSNLDNSVEFWHDILGLKLLETNQERAILVYKENQVHLQLNQIDVPVNHAEAYGRIAFSVPQSELPVIQKKVQENGYTVLKPMISLDTPGKATVTVVILADPDGHEICFVDDENFRKLSEVDPQANILLNRNVLKDEARKK